MPTLKRTPIFVLAFIAILSNSVCAQYFAGPFGPDGTYNLYQIVGATDLQDLFPRIDVADEQRRVIFEEAVLDSRSRVESYTGDEISGHLVTIGSQEELDFVYELLPGSHIGLTPRVDLLEEGAVPLPDEDGRFWITGEPLTYVPVNSRLSSLDDIDGAYLRRNAFWETAAGRRSYVVEYETHLDGPLPLFLGEVTDVPGVDGKRGLFGVREITTSPNGLIGQTPLDHPRFIGPPVENLEVAISVLREPRPGVGEFEYFVEQINFADSERTTGRFDDPRPFASQVPNPRLAFFDLLTTEDVALVARGTIEISPEQAGTWEFMVGADDGVELLIEGKEFYNLMGASGFGTRIFLGGTRNYFISPYGSLTQPFERAFTQGVGSVDLEAGRYDLELIYNERSGFAAVELSARAPGAEEFFLVGSTNGLQLVPEASSGVMCGWVAFAFSLLRRRNGQRVERMARRG